VVGSGSSEARAVGEGELLLNARVCWGEGLGRGVAVWPSGASFSVGSKVAVVGDSEDLRRGKELGLGELVGKAVSRNIVGDKGGSAAGEIMAVGGEFPSATTVALA